MKLETAQMIDTKREIVSKLQELLKADPRSGVEKLAYKVLMKEEKAVEEGIVIYFRNGVSRRICTTSNSNAANIKAVHEVVYGKVWS